VSVSGRTKSIIEGTPYVSNRLPALAAGGLELKVFASDQQMQVLIATPSSIPVFLQPFEVSHYPHSSFFDEEILHAAIESTGHARTLFAKTTIGIFVNHFLLVPDRFAASGFSGNSADSPDGGAAEISDSVTALSSSLQYRLPVSLLDSLQKVFPSGTVQHTLTGYLQTLAEINQGLSVYAILIKGQVSLLHFSAHQLQFINSFSFYSADDFIYFVMAFYHTLDLSPENIPLILFGEVLKDSAIYSAANKYIRQVKLGKAPAKWKYEDDYPFLLHFYSPVFTL
jgi:hypothetical protein